MESKSLVSLSNALRKMRDKTDKCVFFTHDDHVVLTQAIDIVDKYHAILKNCLSYFPWI